MLCIEVLSVYRSCDSLNNDTTDDGQEKDELEYRVRKRRVRQPENALAVRGLDEPLTELADGALLGEDPESLVIRWVRANEIGLLHSPLVQDIVHVLGILRFRVDCR